MKTQTTIASAQKNFDIERFLTQSASALIFSLVIIFSAGCAFSRTETNLTFSPKISNPLTNPKQSLTVGEVKDSRLVKDGHVILHKQNQYGPTSGAYVTRMPVAEIVKGGLVQALRENGFSGANASKYELRGNLQKFEIGGVSGFWKATSMPQLTMRFELLEKSSGEPVWHDTFVGQTTGETAWGGKEFLSDMFRGAANDLAKQLIADKGFRKFLE
jgi:hypothetical protein